MYNLRQKIRTILCKTNLSLICSCVFYSPKGLCKTKRSWTRYIRIFFGLISVVGLGLLIYPNNTQMNVESNGREFPTFASAEHVSSVLERTNLNHLLHFQRISPTQPFLQMKQEESLLPARLEALRHNTEKKESAQPNLSISLGPTLMTSQFHDVDDRSKTTPIFQLASRSRQLLPKPANSAPTTAPPMEPNGSLVSQIHVARPPPEGRGKTQLLPRYWPRITDQELQQLSGQYPHLYVS